MHLYIILAYTIAEIAIVRQRNHYMPVALRGHAIDQIHDTVFKPAHAKAVNNMGDQWWVLQ
jgi:uncharacterized protein YqeY